VIPELIDDPAGWLTYDNNNIGNIQLSIRLTRVPGFRGLIDKMLFDGDHLIYLPKDNVVNMNVEIEPPESMVLPSQVVEHFIQKARYHWIMNFCICRESTKCQDYPRDLGCLFLGEAVLNINPAFGRRVSKEEALEHVRRCREAGLVHLIGRNKLDTVWLGTGPGEKLLTICNCCPCCCLWLVLPTLHESIGSLQLLPLLLPLACTSHTP